MVQLYDSNNCLREFSFYLSLRSGLRIVVNAPLTAHDLPMGMLTSLLLEEILLPRYMNRFTNFWDFPLNVDMAASLLQRINSFFIRGHKDAFSRLWSRDSANARCICKKFEIIRVVCISNSFCWITFIFFSLVWNRFLSLDQHPPTHATHTHSCMYIYIYIYIYNAEVGRRVGE